MKSSLEGLKKPVKESEVLLKGRICKNDSSVNKTYLVPDLSLHNGCETKASAGFGSPGRQFNMRELNCEAGSLIIVSLL